MSDDSAICPNCGSRCVPAPTRTLHLVVTKRYVCGDCGAEWRHAWKPYLATTSLFGGGVVALGAGGVALWTFFAADSDAFGWDAWRTIGIGLAVATIAGVFARRGWRFLRSSPTWIVVERPGLTVDLSSSAEAQPVRTAHRWLSRWKDLAEGLASLGFVTLIAVFGTDTPRKPLGQGNPPLPQGPSRVVQESLRPQAIVPPPIDPSALDADAEPFPEDVQRKIDEWLKRSSTPSEESSAWAERYYDRSWSKTAE